MDIVKSIEKFPLSMTALSVLTGIPANNLYNWKNNKAKPKANDLAKLTNFFQQNSGKTKQELQMMVAMKETEDLLVKESKSKEVVALGKQIPLRLKPEDYADAFGDWAGLPVYNYTITASFLETYQDTNVFRPEYHLHDPRFKDCDFAAIVTGDSMHSEIRHGDYVICQEIVDRRFIIFGDIYYIAASNGLETCKYVNQDPQDKENYLLVPKNEKISPSPIPKEMVRKMYKVKGIIRGY